jgi:hypothetical protein
MDISLSLHLIMNVWPTNCHWRMPECGEAHSWIYLKLFSSCSKIWSHAHLCRSYIEGQSPANFSLEKPNFCWKYFYWCQRSEVLNLELILLILKWYANVNDVAQWNPGFLSVDSHSRGSAMGYDLYFLMDIVCNVWFSVIQWNSISFTLHMVESVEKSDDDWSKTP